MKFAMHIYFGRISFVLNSVSDHFDGIPIFRNHRIFWHIIYFYLYENRIAYMPVGSLMSQVLPVLLTDIFLFRMKINEQNLFSGHAGY